MEMGTVWKTRAMRSRASGRWIETAGAQTMGRQTRGSCAYGALCNLFAHEIQAGIIKTKDVLRLGLQENPKFVSHSEDAGLNGAQIRRVVNQLVQMTRKGLVHMGPRSMAQMMALHHEPVLVSLSVGTLGTDFNKLHLHSVVIGNPFMAILPGGAITIVFETYDTNNPKGVVGYITAEHLGMLYIGGGMMVLPATEAIPVQR
jgi:hypothetical protein